MTRLKVVTWLDQEHEKTLSSLGYESVERVVAVSAIREAAKGLRIVLGISEPYLDQLIRRLTKEFLPEGALASPPPLAINLLGCSIVRQVTDINEKDARPWLGQMHKHGGLPDRVVLVRKDEKIFDQGQRGTCVANAFVKVQEFEYEHQLHKKKEFSRQWFYFCCKQRDGIPNRAGTYMHTAIEVMEQDGCCEEKIWPYSSKTESTEGQGPAPAKAKQLALAYRLHGTSISIRNGVDEVCAALAYGAGTGGFMLVGSLLVFPSCMNAQTVQDGLWPEPLPEEEAQGGHAVVFAGYKLDPNAPDGGWFYCINSWSKNYAAENEIHAGCFRVSFRFMKQYGGDFYALRTKEHWSEIKWFQNWSWNKQNPFFTTKWNQSRKTSSARSIFFGVSTGFLVWLLGIGFIDGEPKGNQRFKRSIQKEMKMTNINNSEKISSEWKDCWNKLIRLLQKITKS